MRIARKESDKLHNKQFKKGFKKYEYGDFMNACLECFIEGYQTGMEQGIKITSKQKIEPLLEQYKKLGREETDKDWIEKLRCNSRYNIGFEAGLQKAQKIVKSVYDIIDKTNCIHQKLKTQFKREIKSGLGEKMRYCYYCKKAMYSSNSSIWIKRKNYDAHKKCIEKEKENQNE